MNSEILKMKQCVARSNLFWLLDMLGLKSIDRAKMMIGFNEETLKFLRDNLGHK